MQTRVQMVIRLQKFQELLVGSAVVVPTYHEVIRFLIVAPTMRVPKIITDPADVMLATRAAVRMRAGISGSITSSCPAWAPAAARCGQTSPRVL